MTDLNASQPFDSSFDASSDFADLPGGSLGDTVASDFDDPAPAPSSAPSSAPTPAPAPTSTQTKVQPPAQPVEPLPLAAPAEPVEASAPVEVEPSLEDAVEAAMAPAIAYAQANGQAAAHKWVVADYEDGGNFAASAAKLADSAVAPLVAAARGYETIDEDTLAEASKRFGLPRKTTAQGKRIAESVTRGDLLIMPWFTTDDIAMADMSQRDPKPTTIQFRPARPDVEVLANGKERERKYEFVGGQKTPIGAHPSFDGAWVNRAPVVLLAEGLLKGDSAITGLLLHVGYTPADLAWDGVGGTAAARQRLTALLNSIPESERVLILTIGGVDNWKNNNEWRDLELRHRAVWVGVDGDVSSNPNVFRACTELWAFLTEKKKTTPSLIAPTVQAAEGEKKIGIDDYLSKYGNWASLVRMLSPKLPPAPPTNDLEHVSKHRISEDGTTLEFCEPVFTDAFHLDVATGGKWKEVLGLGGRILSTVAQRTPTTEEIKSGVLGAGANNDDADWNCEIEISWKDAANQIQRHVISGPASILNYGPDQWDRHKAHIPAPILRNPDWPPPRKISEEWLRAIKANRPDETAVRVRWDSMGWVPVEGTVPAFVVGDQVIGADDAPDIDILAGVTEAELAGANRFGVGDETSGDFDDEGYRNEVRDDIESVIETFVLSGAWTDRKVASTVVAAALRPTLPIRPHTTVFCVGPPSKGKSLTASLMMGFWSRNPGDFSTSSLPGSAKDTAASIELAVARSPIWVVDDLAPASSRQQSEQEQSKIADLVRNVFNGSGKRRSNADMGSRKVHTPRALLVVTAENELQVPSARDRCVTLNIGWGALSASSDPTNRVTEICQEDGAPARVTQAVIRFLRAEAKKHPGGWRGLYDLADGFLRKAQEDAATRMKKRGAKPGDLKRHADLAGDLAVSLLWLRRVAVEVDCRPEILDLLTNDAMIGDVYDLVAMGHKANKESTPGRALVEAVASALFRKKAHILDAIDASAAPGGPNIAPMLGWEMGAEGASRPKGDSIGWLVTDDKTGEQYVLLDQKAAFSIAQKEHPDLVPPGQGSRSSWGSVIGEGLAIDNLRRSGHKPGSKLNTGRAREGGIDLSGVPMSLAVLLARGDRDGLDRNLDDK